MTVLKTCENVRKLPQFEREEARNNMLPEEPVDKVMEETPDLTWRTPLDFRKKARKMIKKIHGIEHVPANCKSRRCDLGKHHKKTRDMDFTERMESIHRAAFDHLIKYEQRRSEDKEDPDWGLFETYWIMVTYITEQTPRDKEEYKLQKFQLHMRHLYLQSIISEEHKDWRTRSCNPEGNTDMMMRMATVTLLHRKMVKWPLNSLKRVYFYRFKHYDLPHMTWDKFNSKLMTHCFTPYDEAREHYDEPIDDLIHVPPKEVFDEEQELQ